MTQALPPRVHLLVASVGVTATLLLGASLAGLARAPPPATWALGAGAAAFVASFVVLEASAVTFVWRGHKMSTSLIEAAIYLGLVAISPPLLVTLVAVALAIVHLRSGRPAIKGIFNIGHGAVAMAAGAAATLGFSSLGVPILAAAALGAIAYTIVNDLQLATLFALIEGVPSTRIYVDRLFFTGVLAIGLGIPTGLALVGLWRIHPVAILAVVPLALLAQRHARLQSQVDREVDVRRRLGDDSQKLIGTAEAGVIADLALRACGDLLDASRARLDLVDGAAFGEEFDEGAPSSREPLTVEIVGRDGTKLGTVSVWERPLKRRYGADERALLLIIAGQAAHALESAQALVHIAAQHDLIARQEKLSALGTMMAGVAHEINNPLTYMKLQLDVSRRGAHKLAERPDATPEERAFAQNLLASFDRFQRGVDRLAVLCNSLKSVARTGDGQRRATDLNDLATEVVTIVRVAHKEIDLQLDLADPGPSVDAVSGELHQVMLNLVKNAAEALAGRESPTIRVSTAQRDGIAWLEVADNGPGIPAAVRDRIFTPFFTTKRAGTGLGLSLSRQIVVAHGGEMDVDSSDVGTTFRVRLPAVPRAVAAAAAHA